MSVPICTGGVMMTHGRIRIECKAPRKKAAQPRVGIREGLYSLKLTADDPRAQAFLTQIMDLVEAWMPPERAP